MSTFKISLPAFFFFTSLLIHDTDQYILKLINTDSESSPYRILNDTLEFRNQRWMELSQRRFKHYLQDFGDDEPAPGYQAPLFSNTPGLMLAEFGLGKPSASQLVVMDTGSAFMWIVCKRSPYMSGNYTCENSEYCEKISCMDLACINVPNGNSNCEFDSNCTFSIHYLSGLSVNGTAVCDTITFDENGLVNFDYLTFGCGNVQMEVGQEGYFKGTGVMGLGNAKSSIASQLGSRFSYCIGDMSDTDYKFNTLILGKKTEFTGMWTPILNISSHVHVNLQQIIVADESLNIDPAIFEGSKYGGGTIIDSGSPYSYLADEAYKALRAKLSKLIPRSSNDGLEDDLAMFCTSNLMAEDVPSVQFVFDRLVVLILTFNSLFHRIDSDTFCLSFMAASSVSWDEDMTLIGLHAQQQHSVAFDYKMMRLYLGPSDCELYHDY